MDQKRLGVSAITTNKWTLAQDVAGYARHGIPHIGIWSFKCEEMSPEEVRRSVEQHNLNVANLCFAGLFTGNTPDARKEAVESTKRHIDFAREINAGCVLLVSGPIQSHTLSDALEYVKEGLLQVTDYAERQGVDLGLEALHPLELTSFSVVNKLETSIELVEAVGSDRLGFFLDTYNNGWDPDLLDLILQCGGRIKGVHLADWRNPARTFTDRVLPGVGVLPVKEVVRVIEETGYAGPYELEIFSEELWDSDYDQMIENFKNWFLQLDAGV